jgi:hypothetical protein
MPQATKIQLAYTTFNNTIQYKPLNLQGGLFVGIPQVLYSGAIYQYNSWGTVATTSPLTYKTPDIDASAVKLYTLGAV